MKKKNLAVSFFLVFYFLDVQALAGDEYLISPGVNIYSAYGVRDSGKLSKIGLHKGVFPSGWIVTLGLPEMGIDLGLGAFSLLKNPLLGINYRNARLDGENFQFRYFGDKNLLGVSFGINFSNFRYNVTDLNNKNTSGNGQYKSVVLGYDFLPFEQCKVILSLEKVWDSGSIMGDVTNGFNFNVGVGFFASEPLKRKKGNFFRTIFIPE